MGLHAPAEPSYFERSLYSNKLAAQSKWTFPFVTVKNSFQQYFNNGKIFRQLEKAASHSHFEAIIRSNPSNKLEAYSKS